MDGRAQAHQITPQSVYSPLIVGWMDHIPDGSKWPGPYPEQREPQPEQFLAEWQVVTARQEKNLKNCVVLQEALRVQREVDLAKQEERAEELRYLFNKLTSNPCAVQEKLALRLSQIEAATAGVIAASAPIWQLAGTVRTETLDMQAVAISRGVSAAGGGEERGSFYKIKSTIHKHTYHTPLLRLRLRLRELARHHCISYIGYPSDHPLQ